VENGRIGVRGRRRGMRIRHAAVLTLVGWYLMVPPIRILGPASDPKTPVEFDRRAPLSEWKILGSFDTAKACYDYPAHLEKLLHRSGPAGAGADEAAKAWFDKAQCIATDDPRLKAVPPN
jgi:hypothetical protein